VPVAYAQQRITTALHRLEQRLDDLSFRMESAISETLRERQRTVGELTAAVLSHDPRQQLSAAREVLASCQSRLDYALDRRLAVARYRCQSIDVRLYRAAQISMTAHRSEWTNLRGRLQALSPLAVLQRGYALVQDANGALIRSVNQVAVGETVRTRLSDGGFSSNVTAIQPNKEKKDKPTPK